MKNLEYIPTGGASGMRLFIDKFSPKDNQNVIGILDYDLAGQSEVKELLTDEEQRELEKNGFSKTAKSKNTFLLNLPKPDRINESQYEIEDYFPTEKLITISKNQIDTFKVIKNFTLKKDTVKRKLFDEVETYGKDDFNDFRNLLDLILKIKRDCSKNEADVQNINNPANKVVNTPKDLQPLPVKNKDDENVFYFKTKGIEAKGKFDESNNSFILLKDSEIVKECVPAAKDNFRKKRNDLINSKKHKLNESSYLIEENIPFDSPSGAAKFVNGGSKNGLVAWKDKDGKTLNEVYRKNQ